MQCAEVVGIIKRGWHPIAATLQPDVVSPLWVLAVPLDPRLPKVRFQTHQEQLLKGKTIVVALDSWDATSRYPTGHYVRTLGETGDKNVEAEALCIDFEVDTRAFSQKVINCLPPKTWVVRSLHISSQPPPTPPQHSKQHRNPSFIRVPAGTGVRLRRWQRPRGFPCADRDVC